MKIDFNDLYFGVTTYDPFKKELRTWNLFDHHGVKRAVANWILMSDARKAEIDNPIMYLFSDVWSRTEFECILCPWPFNEKDTIGNSGMKVDVFTLYVQPNTDLLLDMVDKVSAKSAREWRTADNKRRKG